MTLGQFADGGKAYVINTPFTPTPWTNILFNTEFELEITQRLEGGGRIMFPNYSSATFNGADNKFYISVDGKNYACCRGQGANFQCEHRLYQTEISEEFDGVIVKIRIFVPVAGAKEFWTVTLENTSNCEKNIAFYSYFPFAYPGHMSYEARYDEQYGFIYQTGFHGYTKYEDKANAEAKTRYRYCISNEKPNSYECNKQRFFGCDDTSVMPEAVKNGKCANGSCELETCVSVMQHVVCLKPQEERQIHLTLGTETKIEKVQEIAANFPDVSEELDKIKAFWETKTSRFMIDTPNTDLNYLTNYWLKRQLVYLTKLNRGGTYCPIRNQLQDYLGYSLIDPDDAYRMAEKIVERQHLDGYIKQWYNTNGAPDNGLCLVKHSDPYIWLIICLIEIVHKTGDASLFKKPIGYIDSPVKEPLIVHLKKAAYYMLTQIGEHGLCLMLDGDWNDPVNGPGHLGKGESTWNSMALCYAIERLNEVDFDANLDNARKKMLDAINEHCWDGDRYVAGLDDNGNKYGCEADNEAKKFLNAQTWGIICGAATGDRLEKCVATVETMKNDFGYVLIDPPFSEYNPTWGRVSLKQCGTTENGSVYIHAVMFKAMSDCVRGDGNAALNTILSVLPTSETHGPEKSLQAPIYYSNYYFGKRDENYGRSSFVYKSGSVAWHFWVLLEHIFGMNTSAINGVTLKPNIPDSWNNATLTRTFAGQEYTVEISDGKAQIK